jgi:hypothetical protein
MPEASFIEAMNSARHSVADVLVDRRSAPPPLLAATGSRLIHPVLDASFAYGTDQERRIK